MIGLVTLTLPLLPGLPAVVVGIVVAVDKNSYGLQEYSRGEPGDGASDL